MLSQSRQRQQHQAAVNHHQQTSICLTHHFKDSLT